MSSRNTVLVRKSLRQITFGRTIVAAALMMVFMVSLNFRLMASELPERKVSGQKATGQKETGNQAQQKKETTTKETTIDDIVNKNQ